MTGPEHYREAERLVGNGQRELERATSNTVNEAVAAMASAAAAAQVHATLALAAATALGTAEVPADGNTAGEWRRLLCKAQVVNS